jgi:hypothetical protein
MDRLVRIVTVVVSSAAIALYLAVHSARPHARCEGRRNCFFAAHNHVPREKTTASMRMRRSIRACGARTAPAAATLTAGNGSGGTSTPTYAHPPTTVRSTTDPSRPRLREHAQDAQGTARRRKRAWGHAGAFGFTFIARQRRGLIITVAGGSCMRDCRRPPGPAKEGIGDRRGFELRGHGLMGLRRTAHRRRRGSCGSPLALGEVAVAPERAPPPLATYVSLQRQNNNLSLKTASWSACMQKKNRIDDISHIQH